MDWGWEADCAMKKVQEAIADAQELTVWRGGRPTRVSTDASNVGLGAIFEQKDENDQWKIVSSWSKKLTACQQNYSATDREWLAVVESVSRVWRHWLLGTEFQVRTDHAALREILTKKGEDFTPRQLRWYERLEPYAFTVTYVKGKDNVAPDALSRTPAFYLNAIELGHDGHNDIGLDALRDVAKTDSKYQKLLQEPDTQRQVGVRARDGLLVTVSHGQVCVPSDDILCYKLALEAHEPPFAGHFSADKTLAQAKRYWWWPGMRATVERVVKGCPTCQSDAVKRQHDQGPFRPILASQPWEIVTIDFVSGFAPSARQRHTACCVVCDRFSRMIHIESCRDHATARETVGMVLRMIFARHGCPRVILSDRGTQFDCELWREVWKLLGTRVALATTHHPQTNGLTERLNRTLISLVRKYAHQNPRRWAELLPLFEFAYNAAVHATTKTPPFMANNGYLPPVPAQMLSMPRQLAEPSDVTVQAHVQRLHEAAARIQKLVADNDRKGAATVKEREDRARGKPLFQVGDEVLVYWVPFRAYNEEARKHRLRYVGPFTVTSVPSQGVVELDGLPERMPRLINTQYVHRYLRDVDPQLASLRNAPQPPLPDRAHRQV